MEDDIAQSKLRYKMTGPYKVTSATPETITVEPNGKEVTLSNDLCMHEPKTETEYPDQRDKADDITDTSTADNANNSPKTIEDARERHATHSDTDDKDAMPSYHVPTHTADKP